MAKKIVVMMTILAVIGAGMVFADDEDNFELIPEPKQHKHHPFDVLLGINAGSGLTPNFFTIIPKLMNNEPPSMDNYGLIIADAGLTVDFYILPWLSFNSGLSLRPALYLFLGKNIDDVDDFEITDWATFPFCLTIPIAMHVNIPVIEWLYAGIGLNLNIPLFSPLDAARRAVKDATGDIGADMDVPDVKGKFYIGLPIDIGFDFFSNKKPGSSKGGMRLFFRITPEFHEQATVVPIGLVWQIWNFNVFTKK